MNNNNRSKLQSSVELLITMSFGLFILLPVILLAFIQISNSNASLSGVEAQQAASKLSNVASLVGSEGPPSRQFVQINIPPGVENIFVGNTMNGVGHQIIFQIVSPVNTSYVATYTPVNVSGNLGGISSTGTYLVNVSALSQCPSAPSQPCVYLRPVV